MGGGAHKFMGRCSIAVRYKKLWEEHDGEKRSEEPRYKIQVGKEDRANESKKKWSES